MTRAQLVAIMPRLGAEGRAEKYLPSLVAAMREADVTTDARKAAFLAQLAHESGELRWWEELWGPTRAQRGYEGRRDLGNTQQGDGYRYRGRGPIQLTGRANYRRAGEALGLPLEQRPDLVAEPAAGFRVAAWYWRTRGLNGPADRGDFWAVTFGVNGGLNGLAARRRYYKRARRALAVLPDYDESSPA